MVRVLIIFLIDDLRREVESDSGPNNALVDG